MDFEADWQMFCPPYVGIVNTKFKMVKIPGQKYSYMETPVTQELYEEIMGENPSHFKGCPQNPVESVLWGEALEFCVRLSERTGQKFRLPKKEVWVHCSLFEGFRGDVPSDFWRVTELTDHAVTASSSIAPVKSKVPNPYGLYDMIGNVWEWTSSPTGHRDRVVVCGYSWRTVHITKSAFTNVDSKVRRDTVGFRCVQEQVVDFSGFPL